MNTLFKAALCCAFLFTFFGSVSAASAAPSKHVLCREKYVQLLLKSLNDGEDKAAFDLSHSVRDGNEVAVEGLVQYLRKDDRDSEVLEGVHNTLDYCKDVECEKARQALFNVLVRMIKNEEIDAEWVRVNLKIDDIDALSR